MDIYITVFTKNKQIFFKIVEDLTNNIQKHVSVLASLINTVDNQHNIKYNVINNNVLDLTIKAKDNSDFIAIIEKIHKIIDAEYNPVGDGHISHYMVSTIQPYIINTPIINNEHKPNTVIWWCNVIAIFILLGISAYFACR